jgi:hypothetical protein
MDEGNFFSNINWGTEHPYYGARLRADGKMPRIAWTPIEVAFIGETVEDLKRRGERTPVAKCRMKLLHHVTFHPHFHREHVLNLSKFEHGYKRYQKNLQKAKENQQSSSSGVKVNDSLPSLPDDDDEIYSDSECSILSYFMGGGDEA